MKTRETCANCQAELVGEYCHNCGQASASKESYALRNLLIHAFSEITDVDSKLLKSARKLVLNPGFLTSEFFNGKRQPYLSPVKLYVLFSVIYFIVFSFFPDKNIFSIESIYYTDFTGTAERTIADAIDAKNIDKVQVLEEFTSVVSYSIYAVAIMFAILFAVILFPLKRYFAEHLIFSLHLMSFIFFADIVLSPLYIFFDNIHFRIWSIVIVVCFYSVFAIAEFYRQPILRSSLLVIAFSSLFWISGMLVAFGVLYYVVEVARL